MHLPMADKKKLYRKTGRSYELEKELLNSTWHGKLQVQYHHLKSNFENYWVRFSRFVEHNSLWHSKIGVLEGKHGSNAGIYFSLLRWCLITAIIQSVVWIALVIIPFVVHHGFDAENIIVPRMDTSYSDSDNFAGLFSGGGMLNNTFYFIGGYTLKNTKYKDGESDTVDIGGVAHNVPGYSVDTTGANLPVLYMLAGYMYVILPLLFAFRGLFHAIQRTFGGHEGATSSTAFASLAFATHEYALHNESAVVLHQISMSKSFRTLLTESAAHEEHTQKKAGVLLARRIIIGIIVLGICTSAVYAVYYTTITYSNSDDQYKRSLPSIVVTLLNAVCPDLFFILGGLEEWESSATLHALTLLRAMFMRILGFYAYFATLIEDREEDMCWETQIGASAYSLYVISMIVEFYTSATSDFMLTYAAKFSFFRKFLYKHPVFNFKKHTVELLYQQTLLAFGIFFCPALAFWAVFRCVVNFYIKSWSTTTFCVPQAKGAYFSSYSLKAVVWFSVLLSVFVGAAPLSYASSNLSASGDAMPIAWQRKFFYPSSKNTNDLASYVDNSCSLAQAKCEMCNQESRNLITEYCWSDNVNMYKLTLAQVCAMCPSGCSPFRNYDTAYNALEVQSRSWPSWYHSVEDFVGTVAFATMVICILGSLLIVQEAKSSARKLRAQKLEVEIQVYTACLKNNYNFITQTKRVLAKPRIGGDASLGKSIRRVMREVEV